MLFESGVAMTLEHAYFLSQIVSTAGVLASLIYLSLQIHNNTRELRTQSYYNSIAMVQRINEMLIEDDNLARVVSEGNAKPETLSTQEWDKFTLWNFSFFNTWEYAFYQAHSSSLPESIWTGADAYYKDYIGKRKPGGGLARFWSENRVAYAEPFRSHVEACFR